ncbi:MAG: NAD-dependent epimerase/dehydratase family protein [Candidatus Riflebacteria bacterium]|nr:NAD-dependent epimerase/dehydratase family protein [Candidatus Riflebacteria bacterium]
MAFEKIVVIGSNSFSGAHFVAHCLEKQAHVIGMSRSPEPDAVFLPYKKQNVENFSFYQLDLNKDTARIIEIINDFQPEYVVNFAAQSMVAESWANPEHWFETNVVANVKLHDQLRRCAFLKKYVHVSTPEVYGTCQGTVKENTNYNPSTPYAVSRAAADLSLMSFYRAYNFPVVFTRAANVFGWAQQLYRIIPRTILFFLLGRKLQLHGGGHSVRSFIHIQDVVEGTLSVARQGKAGDIYHFSTSRHISIRELVELIARRMNVSFEEHVEVVGERLGKDSAYLLDSQKAADEFGWAPKVTLEQGIDETVRWVKDNLDVIREQPFDYIHKP